MQVLRVCHRMVRGEELFLHARVRETSRFLTKSRQEPQLPSPRLLPQYRDRWSVKRLISNDMTLCQCEKIAQSPSMSTRCISGRRLEKDEYLIVDKYMERLQRCVKQSAIQTSQRLSFEENLMGINSNLKNGSMGSVSLNAFLLGIKKKFPEEVLLCRVSSLTCALRHLIFSISFLL